MGRKKLSHTVDEMQTDLEPIPEDLQKRAAAPGARYEAQNTRHGGDRKVR